MNAFRSSIFLSLPWVCLIASIPVAWANAGEPILVYQTLQSEYPVHGFEGNRAFTLSDGKKQYLPIRGRFMLKADCDALLSHGHFTPLFSRCFLEETAPDDPDTEKMLFRFSVGNKNNRQNSWVNTFVSLRERWSIPEKDEAVFIFALLSPHEQTHPASLYQHVPIPSGGSTRLSFRNSIELTAASDRIPVILHISREGQLRALSSQVMDPGLLKCLLEDDADALSRLLQVNPGIADRKYDGFSLLHLVSAWGSMQCLDLLLTTSPDPDVRSSNRHCPIHLAVGTMRTDVVAALIKAGAKVSLKDAEEDTPLHAAAYHGSQPMARLLVEAGANPKGVNREGLTAAMIAVNEGHFDLFRYLYEMGSKVPLTSSNKQILLVRAIHSGNLDAVEFVLSRWPEVMKTDSGLFPLHVAAGKRNPLILQLLIDRGMDINQMDANRVSALMIASDHSMDNVRILVEAGADIHAVNAKGASALHIAIFKQQFETTRFLLEHGADPNLKGPDGTPILWFAAIVGNRLGLNQLIEAGANCSMSQDDALKLMEYAFRHDIPEIVSITLNQCLDPDFSFYRDIPGLWVAQYYGSTEIESLLRQHGITPETMQEPDLAPINQVLDQIRPVSRPDVHYPENLQDRFGAFTARVQLIIDRDGQVILPRILDNPVQELDRLILEIVDQWVFQPVNIDGVPVRVMCTVPFKFVPTPEEMRVYEIEQTEIRPLLKRQIAPRYPDALKRNKIEGRVNIIFVVDEQGDVLEPRAEWASHEEFIAPSIESIRQWKFSPGYIGGKAVKVRVRAPLVFRVQ